MPERIRRSRAKGWRMPENAFYVGRPTVFGNPFVAAANGKIYAAPAGSVHFFTPASNAAVAYRLWLFGRLLDAEGWRWYHERRQAILARLAELRGKDLACWCPLTYPDGTPHPCHADVLLELANRDGREHG